MHRCKVCGTLYTEALGICPKCSTDDMLKHPEEQLDNAPLSPKEEARMRKRRWIAICIGVPGLIAFIYVILYLLKELQGV